ncbi:hypothetical protein ACT3CE_15565 [Marinifilum sp. RC60d5]|uniref:hypothetical protein n=1 Tax=Marinifilum sp. RC60d5 TaxID=3458414 RepID=UPI00403517AD
MNNRQVSDNDLKFKYIQNQGGVTSRVLLKLDTIFNVNRIVYFIDMRILVPSAILSLLTGWIYSQLTPWGYFKHGWLIFKWVITVLIIVLGTIFSEPCIAKTVEISGQLGLDSVKNSDYRWYMNSHLTMGVCMTGTLIIAVFISILKPKKIVKKNA